MSCCQRSQLGRYCHWKDYLNPALVGRAIAASPWRHRTALALCHVLRWPPALGVLTASEVHLVCIEHGGGGGASMLTHKSPCSRQFELLDDLFGNDINASCVHLTTKTMQLMHVSTDSSYASTAITHPSCSAHLLVSSKAGWGTPGKLSHSHSWPFWPNENGMFCGLGTLM